MGKGLARGTNYRRVFSPAPVDRNETLVGLQDERNYVSTMVSLSCSAIRIILNTQFSCSLSRWSCWKCYKVSSPKLEPSGNSLINKKAPASANASSFDFPTGWGEFAFARKYLCRKKKREIKVSSTKQLAKLMHGIYLAISVFCHKRTLWCANKGGGHRSSSISVSSPFSRSSHPRAELIEKARSRRHPFSLSGFWSKKRSVDPAPPSTWRWQSRRNGGREKSSLPPKKVLLFSCVFLHLWGWREWLLQKKDQHEWENSKERNFSLQLTRENRMLSPGPGSTDRTASCKQNVNRLCYNPIPLLKKGTNSSGKWSGSQSSRRCIVSFGQSVSVFHCWSSSTHPRPWRFMATITDA